MQPEDRRRIKQLIDLLRRRLDRNRQESRGMLGTRHRRSAYTTQYDERELPATAAEPEAVKQFFTFCIDLKQAHHTLLINYQSS